MPSYSDTPSCSPIRGLVTLGRKALSPRRNRDLQPACVEPIIQSASDQNPQPTVTGMSSDQANQHGMMISIPIGGPGEGQQCVHYGPTVCPLPMESHQCPQPPTSDAESGVLSVSTATLEGTPLGDEEPEGFHRSDTEPPTDPSFERVARRGRSRRFKSSSRRHWPKRPRCRQPGRARRRRTTNSESPQSVGRSEH